MYNCSCCQSPKHVSLNDCLIVGDPTLTDLTAILLRFHFHRYTLSTNIKKGFLHIELDGPDKDFTCFLWLADPTNPESLLVTYRVLFGSVSSLSMVSATLDHNLKSYNSSVSCDMKKSLYVDNIMSGCESKEDILHYYANQEPL